MKFTGLWKHPDFMKLWTGQTLSMFGAQITTLALPLIAALMLNVNAVQMGMLTAIGYLPYILFSLFVGVWVDQLRRRPIMILTDVIRGVGLLVIPYAAWEGFLTFELLCTISFLVGTASVFFDIAYMSYLPSIVKTEELVEGNSKLEFSNSASQISGQAIGGALVQLLTAPVAILINGITFFISAFTLIIIKRKEDKPSLPEEKEDNNVFQNIRDGLKFVFGNTILARITVATGLFNLFGLAMEAIYILYVTRELSLSPFMLGLIFTMSGVGAMAGAAVAGKVAEKLSLGKTLVLSLALAGVFYLLVPLSSLLSVTLAIIVLMVSQFVDAAMIVIYNINQRSLRTAITPDHLQGRMNASLRFIIFGSIPVGAMLGGFLGDAIGTQWTLVVGAAGMLISSGVILTSSVAKLDKIPEAPAAAAEQAS
ncbi:MFS transporter [Tumebacillus algifaecis]|uniref:MFS transporter n=1 Tax=Tumebacillus algifaecis TaxID=1214604 RepID=A0A223D1D2_9BACL|nr:MFS transporter [Tumebacillus algifaecis]ASS75392.1 MFS transporter [Tumebacillus algifaecis]